MKTIQADISPESLSKAANQVRGRAEELKRAVNTLCNQLAELGKTVAMANVSIDSGELQSSIKVEKTTDGYQLVADSPYAAFHEFGTGVVGQGTYQYPFPIPWAYDVRRTPEAHSLADPTIWFYWNSKRGRFESTRGQRGHAFMAQAAETMRQQVRPIASEVIGR